MNSGFLWDIQVQVSSRTSRLQIHARHTSEYFLDVGGSGSHGNAECVKWCQINGDHAKGRVRGVQKKDAGETPGNNIH